MAAEQRRIRASGVRFLTGLRLELPMAIFGGCRLVLNRKGIGAHLRGEVGAQNARQMQAVVERIERLAQNGDISAGAYPGGDAVAIFDGDALGRLKVARFERAR